jgi:hypothetical protein
VSALICGAAIAFSSGCQQHPGSPGGPYAASGTLAPTASGPLIPLGPMTGATRVPPPPTGSSQVSNGYDGQGASGFAANSPPGNFGQPGGLGQPSSGSFASTGPLQSSASGARNSMGGMPVIDLTAGMMNQAPPAVIYDSPAPPADAVAAVGSGVAPASWQVGPNIQPGPNISVPENDLASRLRPLDSAQNVTLVPLSTTDDYIPISDAPVMAATQYRSESGGSPAWQAAQPTTAPYQSGANAFEQRSSVGAYSAQSPGPPAASPAPTPGESNRSPSETLLWRNPAVAR